MNDDLTDLQRMTLDQVRVRPKGNEITGKEIANAIGLVPRSTGKSGADMRSIINAVRCKGYPVCANGKGYYWPANQAETDEYIASSERRVEDERKAMNGMRAGRDYEPMQTITI